MKYGSSFVKFLNLLSYLHYSFFETIDFLEISNLEKNNRTK